MAQRSQKQPRRKSNMATVYFSAKYKDLQETLTNPIGASRLSIFPRLRDLMLFTACVGKFYNKYEDRVGNGGEVETRYFSSDGFNKEGVVFLLGLLETEDTAIFKDSARECWILFEKYSNGGMALLESWLAEAESVDEYTKIISQRIADAAHKSKKPVEIEIKKPKLKPVT